MSKLINKFVEAKVPLKIGVVGYSDKKFDKKEALELIRKGLDELVGRRKEIVVVSGLTNLGIPAIAYKKEMGKKVIEYELELLNK